MILHSSDNTDFKVFKLLLSPGSPFFETILYLPQPSEVHQMDIKDGLPVIHVSESSRTLDPLLRSLYPYTIAEHPLSLLNSRDLVDLLGAARKYFLDYVAEVVCEAVFTSKSLKSESLRCFVVARWVELHEYCALAARYSLQEPLLPAWFERYNKWMLTISSLYKKCGDAVQALGRSLVGTSTFREHFI